MKLIIQTGNTDVPTLLNSNKIGTEAFGALAGYKHIIEDGEFAGNRTNSSREIQGELANNTGSIVTVDRTVILAKQSTVKVQSPLFDSHTEVFIDNVGGEKNIGKGSISAMFLKSDDGKFKETTEQYIINPEVSVKALVGFANKMLNDENVNEAALQRLSSIGSINAVSAPLLVEILQEGISDDIKSSKEFIKSSAQIGVDFDDTNKKSITEFRGISFSDIELIEAVNRGYYNKEHYSDTENIIMEDIQKYLKENNITIDVHTVNTNFIDFGHDETGNVVVNKNAKIKEIKNGFMYKTQGLSGKVKGIDIAASQISNLLSPDRSEDTRKKIAQGIESLEMFVVEMKDKNVSSALAKIDTNKVINSKKIGDVSREYNSLMDIAFSVKASILKEFIKDRSFIEPALVKSGEGRIANQKYGYARERGLSIDGEQIIQRMAALHEIRPLTADGGVKAGMQVKSSKVVALEYIFDKDDKLLDIKNAAPLGNYSKTYNKLALVMESLIHGVKNKDSKEKRPLGEKEFEQALYKGKIYGKDKDGNPKYTGYGLKSVEEIFSKQASNTTTGEAIAELRKKIESIAKNEGIVAVQNYMQNSEDKLTRVFREFHSKAFEEFSRNRNIANTQYMNYEKDTEESITRSALKALIDGKKPEELESDFDEKPTREALSLAAKANYVKVISAIARDNEDKRLEVEFREDDNAKKYDDVTYIANSIGRSEYTMKMGKNTFYDTNAQAVKLISPKTNFAMNTDKGILVKNNDGWNVLNVEKVREVLDESKERKKEIAGVISEIIKDKFSGFEKKTHISQGETATLNVKTKEIPREEGGVSNNESAEQEKDKTAYIEAQAQAEIEAQVQAKTEAQEQAETEAQAKESIKPDSVMTISMAEEAQVDAEVEIIKEHLDVEVAQAEKELEVENDIGIDLSLLEFDGDEDIEIQKASEVVKEMQADKPKAVGKQLLS